MAHDYLAYAQDRGLVALPVYFAHRVFNGKGVFQGLQEGKAPRAVY